MISAQRGGAEMSHREIAMVMRCSGITVRRLERSALAKLKRSAMLFLVGLEIDERAGYSRIRDLEDFACQR